MKKYNAKVTKEDFAAYREVQLSSVTNMFDIVTVAELSGLNREKILDIMKNYSAYAKKWS